jgi:hypothetical protein
MAISNPPHITHTNPKRGLGAPPLGKDERPEATATFNSKGNIPMRKLMLRLAPLLAVAAFVAAPAAAQARTTYGTETGGIFTPFPGEARVSVFGTKISAQFIIENEAQTFGWKCSEASVSGLDWNVAGLGHGSELVAFEGCKGVGGLETTCGGTNIPNGNGIIEGEVTDEVATETTVKHVIQNGFQITCGSTNLGRPTGSFTGNQSKKSGILRFLKAGGILFAGEKMTITGEEETRQVESNKAVVI